MNNHILITGGGSLLGKQLTQKFLDSGYSVCHLNCKIPKRADVKTYLWDVQKRVIDPECIRGVDVIIHLGCDDIVVKKPAEEREKELINDSGKSIKLIYDLLRAQENKVNCMVLASSTGFYGHHGNDIVTEESMNGDDFFSKCYLKSELNIDAGEGLGLRVVKLRTGMMLSKHGGALPKLVKSIRRGVGAVLGNGEQWTSWIHINDAVNIFKMAVENDQLSGVYNAVAPFPVTNRTLMTSIAQQFNKYIWLPNLPEMLVKRFYGNIAELVLCSTRALPNKIERAGFNFQYISLYDVLKDGYQKTNKRM